MEITNLHVQFGVNQVSSRPATTVRVDIEAESFEAGTTIARSIAALVGKYKPAEEPRSNPVATVPPPSAQTQREIASAAEAQKVLESNGVAAGVPTAAVASTEPAKAEPKKAAAPKKPKPEPKATVQAEPEDEGELASEPATAPAEPPNALMGATTFRAVILELQRMGFKTAPAITEQCNKFRGTVPAIMRLSGDLSVRVERALEVIAAEAQANA